MTCTARNHFTARRAIPRRSTRARFITAAMLALSAATLPLSAQAGAPGPWVEPADAPITIEATNATIGVARITDGQISIAAYDELDAWAGLAETADIRMISPVTVAQGTGRDVSDLAAAENGIDLIRVTAANLGLDYVILYDTGDGERATPMARTSFTAMGITGFEGPDVDGPQAAKILLVDVYTGQIRGHAEVRPGADTMVSVTRLASRLIDDVRTTEYAGL